AAAIIRKGGPDGFDYSYSGYETGIVARHPDDEGVWLGDIGALRPLPDGVDAVVSLCRVSDDDLPARAEQIDVRLIDRPEANDNLDFVLHDTVRLVELLRREGRTVLSFARRCDDFIRSRTKTTTTSCHTAEIGESHWDQGGQTFGSSQPAVKPT